MVQVLHEVEIVRFLLSNFLGKKALSELLGHNLWRVGVWDYVYRLWRMTPYSVHCCEETTLYSIFCEQITTWCLGPRLHAAVC